MSDKTIELNRRRVLGGLITIGGAAAAAGAGTSAYFFDEQTSTGNTIEAGTLSLGEISQDAVTIGPLYPGGTDSLQVTSEYTGNTPNVDLDVGFALSDETSDLATAVQITTASISDGTTTETISSGSLADIAGVQTGVLSLSSDATLTLNLDVTLPDNGDQNNLRGDTLAFGFALKARQGDAPQLAPGDVSATSP